MTRPLTIEYRGRVQSLKAWTTELQLPYVSTYSRLAQGWTPARAFETPFKKHGIDRVQLTHDGRTMSVRDWGKHLGVSPTLIEVRLSKGWPLDKVLRTTRQTTAD